MNKNLRSALALLLCCATALLCSCTSREQYQSMAGDPPISTVSPVTGAGSAQSVSVPGTAVTAVPSGNASDNGGVPLVRIDSTLRISEVMSSNKSTVAVDGLFPDWVELTNIGTAPLNLSNTRLRCDDVSFALPATELAPGSYLTLWCDGSGSDSFHTPFKLDKKGCTLTLENNAGVLDLVMVPALSADQSAVRQADGSLVTTNFATPGYSNDANGYELFQRTLGSPSPLQIYEAVVYNQWYLRQTDYYDFVELKNVSASPVKLSDYYLSDKDSDRAMYRLPERTLEPGAIFVVYCTGSGEVSLNGAGAPFGLSADTEQLYLSASDGGLVDYACLHDIPYHGSMGRLDGQNGYFLFDTPSPAENNTNGCRSIAAAPVSSQPDGIYNGVDLLTVSLSADGEIRYTTDGSMPTRDSELYTAPLTVSKTSVIRAVTYRDGFLPSEPTDLSYIINENHTLPVVSLVGTPSELISRMYNNPGQEIEVLGSVALFEEDNSFHKSCGIKLHGATSKFAQSKKSFKLCFRDRYDGALDYDLFGNDITHFASILLRAAQESTYSTLMRDNLAHQLAIRAFPNLPAQDYKYSVLYINGQYWGVYNIREAHSTTHYAEHYGYDEETVTQWKEKWSNTGPMAEILSFALSHNLANEENYARVAERLHLDSIIGWTIMEAYTGNFDSNPPNMRFYYSTADGKMAYALADLDLGMFSYDIFDTPLKGPVSDGMRVSYGYNRLVSALMQNKSFQLEMAKQLSAALKGPMSNDNVLALIDQLADELRPEIARDRQRWRIGGDSDTVDYWEHGFQMVDYLRDFVSRKDGRAKYVVNSFIAHSGLTSAEIQEYFSEWRS